MPAQLPAVCSACHEPLGEPEDEVEGPEEDKPDAHFKIQIRSDGEQRMQCRETGQLSKPLGPDDDDYPHDKFGSEPEQEQENVEQEGQTHQSDTPNKQGQVYDFKEDKSPIDLLQEVVTNPSYGLDDDQINEIRAWALDYDGQLPPDTLEDIAALMEGVQKQTAQLMKQRYELKLNKWMAEQQSGDRGPSIGMSNPFVRSNSTRIRTPDPSVGPSRESMMQAQQMGPPDSAAGPSNSDARGSPDDGPNRREKRRKGRRQAASNAFDTMANKAAENIGEQMGTNYGRGQDIAFRVLEAKAQKDPDWFLEKAQQIEENLGISIWDIFESSDAKKSEQNTSRSQPSVDNESDAALQAAMNRPPQTNGHSKPIQSQPPQNNDNINGQTDEIWEDEQMDEFDDMFDDDIEDQDHQTEDDEFEQIFGDQ